MTDSAFDQQMERAKAWLQKRWGCEWPSRRQIRLLADYEEHLTQQEKEPEKHVR